MLYVSILLEQPWRHWLVAGVSRGIADPAQGFRSDLAGRLSCTKKMGRVVETPVEARAGFLDRPVLVLLTVSTIAVIALFAVIYAGFFTL